MALDYRQLGENVRLHRMRLGMKQSELAERVDSSSQHISHIECGGAKVSLPLLVELANVLHTSVDTLLGTSQTSDRHKILLVRLASLLEDAPAPALELCVAVCQTIVDRQPSA